MVPGRRGKENRTGRTFGLVETERQAVKEDLLSGSDYAGINIEVLIGPELNRLAQMITKQEVNRDEALINC